MLTSRAVILNTVNAAVNQTSAVLPCDHMTQISVQAFSTGTSTGTLKVQVSNDNPGVADVNGFPTVTNWVDLATQTVPITAAGQFLIPSFDVCYAWMRFVYTATNAAAGTLTVQFKSNGF